MRRVGVQVTGEIAEALMVDVVEVQVVVAGVQDLCRFDLETEKFVCMNFNLQAKILCMQLTSGLVQIFIIEVRIT